MNGEKEQDQQKRREGSQTSMGDGHVNVNHGSYASEKAGWGDGERFYCNAYSHGMAWFKVKIMVNQFDQSIVQSVQTETVLYCTYKRGDLARAVYPLLSFAPLTLTEGERERERQGVARSIPLRLGGAYPSNLTAPEGVYSTA
jgi:hypothetical protein